MKMYLLCANAQFYWFVSVPVERFIYIEYKKNQTELGNRLDVAKSKANQTKQYHLLFRYFAAGASVAVLFIF